MYTRIVLASVALLSLAACVVEEHPHHRTYRPAGAPVVVIDHNDDYYYDQGYRKCPPGHAKKGWC